MALTISNVKKSYFGDMKVTYGEFTCSAGDAAGTIGVEGGWVMAQFHSLDSSGNWQQIPFRYSASTSGAVTTLTIRHLEDVTTGRFIIFHR
jgi:hypothetical protein